jgi:hypothetical protein
VGTECNSALTIQQTQAIGAHCTADLRHRVETISSKLFPEMKILVDQVFDKIS